MKLNEAKFFWTGLLLAFVTAHKLLSCQELIIIRSNEELINGWSMVPEGGRCSVMNVLSLRKRSSFVPGFTFKIQVLR